MGCPQPAFSAARSSTARARGALARRARRYATGSFPAAAASSSMKPSTMKALCVDPDAAPPGGGHAGRRLLADVVHQHIGKAVRPGGALDGVAVEAVLESSRQPTRQDRRAGDPVTEGDRRAADVQGRGHAVIVERPVDVVLDVLLAGPDHLHRALDLLGDLHRLGDAVDLQPAAEAAAEQVIVDLDLVQRQAGDLRCRRLRAGQDLRAHPDVAAIRAHVHRAVHRLHGGVGQQRELVDRLECAGGARHGLGDIAILHGDHAGPLQRLLDAARSDRRWRISRWRPRPR